MNLENEGSLPILRYIKNPTDNELRNEILGIMRSAVKAHEIYKPSNPAADCTAALEFLAVSGGRSLDQHKKVGSQYCELCLRYLSEEFVPIAAVYARNEALQKRLRVRLMAFIGQTYQNVGMKYRDSILADVLHVLEDEVIPSGLFNKTAAVIELLGGEDELIRIIRSSSGLQNALCRNAQLALSLSKKQSAKRFLCELSSEN